MGNLMFFRAQSQQHDLLAQNQPQSNTAEAHEERSQPPPQPSQQEPPQSGNAKQTAISWWPSSGPLFTVDIKLHGDVSDIAIKHSAKSYHTWGGSLSVISPRHVRAIVNDLDGDVFLVLHSTRPARKTSSTTTSNRSTRQNKESDDNQAELCVLNICVADYAGPHQAMICKMLQRGVATDIHLMQSDDSAHAFYYDIDVAITHQFDCKWNGDKCQAC
eukprot:TRINITY_DN10381_c0_g1_i1.p1 TRINITY_DN10381_c0_g1~~TRINITY_DN10381_c0_g1_i1.p1  ORF type:complete len:217 (-),score=48.50 TRINITY_DN10381_c0_g1_i1:666-1316(-)